MNLRDFSDLLGLSPTTVSRALGGYPEVSETTRKLVIEAARKHGYRPNRRAASLATGRAMAIGHVIPLSRNHEMVNPVFMDFIAGAGEIYAAQNYDLFLSVVSDADELKAYEKLAAAGSVDGIIVHGPRNDDPRIDFLREIGLPFVVHGRAPVSSHDYHFVDIDNFRAFSRATKELLGLGHRRIALLNGLESMDFARRRRDGFLAAMTAADAHVDPRFRFSGEMSEQNGYAAAQSMLSHADKPTAFLVSSLIMAIGARRAINDAGLSLVKDVSVITHDDMLGYLSNGADAPVFTATTSSVRAAGRRCAEILLGQIQSPSSEPIQEVWESDFVVGRSTGAPSQSMSET